MNFEVCHGCLDREKEVPNIFLVDFQGRFRSCCSSDDALDETIDYASVYDAVKEVMLGNTRNLLETLTSDIIDKVREKNPGFEEISVCVSKKNPPLGGKCEWARIEEHWAAKKEKKND